MLVDPRPYTYEYRKPRYSNPTLYTLIHLANHSISMIAFITDTLSNRPMTTLTRFQASMKKEIEFLGVLRSKIPVGSTVTTPRSKARTITMRNITEIWWLKGTLKSMILVTNFRPLAKIHKSSVLKLVFQKTFRPIWWASLSFYLNGSKDSNALEFTKDSKRLITSLAVILRSKRVTN